MLIQFALNQLLILSHNSKQQSLESRPLILALKIQGALTWQSFLLTPLSQQNEADNTAAIAHDIAMAYKVMNTAFFPDSVEFFKHSSAFGSSTPASIVEEVLAVHKFVVLLPDSNLTFQGAHLLRCARNIVLA